MSNVLKLHGRRSRAVHGLRRHQPIKRELAREDIGSFGILPTADVFVRFVKFKTGRSVKQ